MFLTGQEEIESCERLLQERSKLLTPAAGNKQQGAIEGLTVLPMYAALPPDMQMRVFEPAESGKRKVNFVSRFIFSLVVKKEKNSDKKMPACYSNNHLYLMCRLF